MTRRLVPVLLGACVLAAPATARAQDWRPPSRQMPEMPAASALQGGASAAGFTKRSVMRSLCPAAVATTALSPADSRTFGHTHT